MASTKQRVPSASNQFVDEATRNKLKHLVSPHVDSFNYFLELGIRDAIDDMEPMDMKLGDDGPYIRMQFVSAQISYPTKQDDANNSKLCSACVQHFSIQLFANNRIHHSNTR